LLNLSDNTPISAPHTFHVAGEGKRKSGTGGGHLHPAVAVVVRGRREIEEQQVGDKKPHFMVFICCGNCLKGACETVKPLRAYISATFTDKTAHELLMSGVQLFKN
jgi:hypothetical protein